MIGDKTRGKFSKKTLTRSQGVIPGKAVFFISGTEHGTRNTEDKPNDFVSPIADYGSLTFTC